MKDCPYHSKMKKRSLDNEREDRLDLIRHGKVLPFPLKTGASIVISFKES